MHHHVRPDGARDFGQSGGREQFDFGGKRKQLSCRDSDLFPIAPTGEQSTNLVADSPSFDAFADFADRARTFESDDFARTGWRRIVSLTLQQVSTVDGARGDLDDDFAFTGHGIGDLGPFENIGIAGLTDGDRVHTNDLIPVS